MKSVKITLSWERKEMIIYEKLSREKKKKINK